MKTGTQLKNEGIKKAVDHANEVEESWSELAYKKLKEFLRSRNEPFMTEDFRAWVGKELQPPHARAYGGIMRKAAKEGLIENIGHRQVVNPKAHCAYACLWYPVK